MEIRSNKQLIDKLSQGEKVKYVFFWGHQDKKGKTTKSCFSQWHDSPFEESGIKYLTAEHYMMHAKANLFNDLSAAAKALAAKTPGEAKAIGREIQAFDEKKWLKHRFEIVVKANLAKFSHNTEQGKFLISTGDRVLVEASPIDKIWGIGLAKDNPSIEQPCDWKGLNLLGYALMEVREKLTESQ
jgi:ribA/ribD-fused uncharacterized protein